MKNTILAPLALIPLLLAGCEETKTAQPVVTQEQVAETTAVAKPASPTQTEHPNLNQRLLSLEVPSLCGHQPGQLVNGELPTSLLKDGRGSASVLTAEASNLEDRVVAVEVDVNQDGKQEIVVQTMCDQGGVGWPSSLMVLDQDLRVLASELRAADNQARGTLEKIDVVDGKLYLKWRAMGPKDAACCPSLVEEGFFRLDAGRLVPLDAATSTPTESKPQCQPGRIAAELGRNEKDTHVSFCDGRWASFGKAATEDLNYALFDGGRWQPLKADGTMTTGVMAECFLPETVTKLNPPPSVSLPICQPGQYEPAGANLIRGVGSPALIDLAGVPSASTIRTHAA